VRAVTPPLQPPLPSSSRLRLHRYLRAAKADKVDHERFASKLWGDSYFNAASRTFQPRPPTSDAPRSFVEFILEPMCVKRNFLAAPRASRGIFL